MKKTLLLLTLIPLTVHAAEIQPIWGKIPPSIATTQFKNQLQLVKDKNGHRRYQVVYKGIPVWGYQLIEHSKGKISYSGYMVSGIEKDISSLTPALNKGSVIRTIAARGGKNITIKTVIYIRNKKARLAYHVKYYTMDNHKPANPNKIIDANDGTVLKAFNALRTRRVGQGSGGNYIRLPSRSGDFYYGQPDSRINSLGRFDVTVAGGTCRVANSNFEVVNLQNKAFDWDLFPISAATQDQYPVFSYPCSRHTQYVNYDDGGYAPINEGLSPVNDAMYFAQTTLDMYQQLYGDDKPFGDDLPVRAYVHVANLDNAFAIGTEYENGRIHSHQQIVIGNGEEYFAPMSQTTIPHELSHNVTNNYSGLIYDGQSGGIDEAFSDMADLALRDYLSRLYPWYWDGKDWSIGREEALDGIPLRYMENPGDDGYSIASAEEYHEGLDVHFSSGVFNRAFFLLAHQPGWNAQKAFQVMFDANRYYWVPNTNFDFASCGVIQAAMDRGWDMAAVIDAFHVVAVRCPLV
ncbi:M4 family metallopeptidase [Legionella spiritensis]|uniref:M4 family metallopeptidase n=1 Tax=Legionella spiritensis TaxID=452 RepID=UPI000F7144D3|nr:M4 family metallopeptidase [Legionella spiritensis]VEG90228.1 virulence metalloprotease [Legionella spiritensis]